MKTYKKALILIALVVVIAGSYAAYRAHRIQNSYYPMGGEVTIISKEQTNSACYLVIEEATGEQFTLLCNEGEYEQVSIGDTVNCERSQSILTHKGEIHSIQFH